MTRDRAQTKFIVVHSSATPPSTHVDARVIDRWHRANGWFGIGYHKVIRRDGVIEDGRAEATVGAHAGPAYNSMSVAVCMAGGVAEANVKQAENNFTAEQFASLKGLLRQWKEKYPDAQIVGHRDLQATECPSFNVREWAASVGL